MIHVLKSCCIFQSFLNKRSVRTLIYCNMSSSSHLLHFSQILCFNRLFFKVQFSAGFVHFTLIQIHSMQKFNRTLQFYWIDFFFTAYDHKCVCVTWRDIWQLSCRHTHPEPTLGLLHHTHRRILEDKNTRYLAFNAFVTLILNCTKDTDKNTLK